MRGRARLGRSGVVALALLARCSALPHELALQPASPAADATIYVIDRGWHTDIGLPAEEVTGRLAVLRRDFPGARTLVLGFGDRAYVLAGEKTFGNMIRALFPGRGMMLLTGLRTGPADAFGTANVIALHVSDAGLHRLLAFIWNDLEKDASGAPKRAGDGPYLGSVFYDASAIYAGYYTCNTWTADALTSAGLPVSADGVVLAHQVMDLAGRLAARQVAERPLPEARN